jgi:hypothetical protein
LAPLLDAFLQLTRCNCSINASLCQDQDSLDTSSITEIGTNCTDNTYRSDHLQAGLNLRGLSELPVPTVDAAGLMKPGVACPHGLWVCRLRCPGWNICSRRGDFIISIAGRTLNLPTSVFFRPSTYRRARCVGGRDGGRRANHARCPLLKRFPIFLIIIRLWSPNVLPVDRRWLELHSSPWVGGCCSTSLPFLLGQPLLDGLLPALESLAPIRNGLFLRLLSSAIGVRCIVLNLPLYLPL